MEGLYTNSSARGDFFFNAFETYSRPPCHVYIAVAFFTDPQPILDLARNGCQVHLIVRLGYPTSPASLGKLIDAESIQVRYFNDSSFHPKLYIFTGNCIIVGSSNLTGNALKSNQEVNITLLPEDPRYSELIYLFNAFWNEAKVLDSGRLIEYDKLFKYYTSSIKNIDNLERETQDKLGRATFSNIERGLKGPSHSELYLEGYRVEYQQFIEAFRAVEKVYEKIGKRKVSNEKLPLIIEIGSGLLGWLREAKTIKDSYRNEPLLNGDKLELKIKQAIEDWFQSNWQHFETIITTNYPTIVTKSLSLNKNCLSKNDQGTC